MDMVFSEGIFLESSSGAKCSLKITLSAVRQSRTFCHILTCALFWVLLVLIPVHFCNACENVGSNPRAVSGVTVGINSSKPLQIILFYASPPHADSTNTHIFGKTCFGTEFHGSRNPSTCCFDRCTLQK